MTRTSPPSGLHGFRDDINTLRAIAVCAVVLFHFLVPGFEGGFVGVDIFFVVSGYLMTKVIAGRLDTGRFSVLEFYKDRARRIIPPLLVVSAVLLAFGAAFIDPLALRTIGGHVVSSVTFWSNLDYQQTAGYFDTAAESKFLLHTWSLSVEWQFYILYPFLFLPLRWWPGLRSWLMPVLALGVIGSFAIALILLQMKPTLAFYALPSRAWEMVLGGLVATLDDRFRLSLTVRRIVQAIGLAMILAVMTFVDKYTPWPSIPTLLPVIGTALIIFANDSSLKAIHNPVVSALGRWSYSIYLWHWPVVAALSYYGVRFTPVPVIVAIVAVIVVSAFSFRFIEQGSQRWLRGGRGSLRYPVLLAVIAIVAGAGWVTYKADGFTSRGGQSQTYATLSAASRDWSFPNDRCGIVKTTGEVRPCQQGDGATGGVAFLGDSHAEQWYARAEPALIPAGGRVVYFTQGGCPPLPRVSKIGQHECSHNLDRLLEAVEAGGFHTLILTASWPAYFPAPDAPGGPEVVICIEGAGGCRKPTHETYQQDVEAAFQAMEERLRPLSRRMKIVFLLDAPSPHFDVPATMAKRAYLPGVFGSASPALSRAQVEKNQVYVNGLIRRVAGHLGADVVDPLTTACDATSCPIQTDGVPWYWDSSHLTSTAIRSDAYAVLDPYLFAAGPAP